MPALQDVLQLRENTNEAYVVFCEKILSQVVGKAIWKEKSDTMKMSKVATVSDEAFALLILENSYELWDDLAQHDGEAGYKSQLKTLYTKNGAGTKKYQGWAPEGITRFRALVEEVKKDRATPNGKMFEREQRNQKAAKKGSKKNRQKEEEIVNQELENYYEELGIPANDDSSDEENEVTQKAGV